jgi:hypothetical protein
MGRATKAPRHRWLGNEKPDVFRSIFGKSMSSHVDVCIETPVRGYVH